jgi:hypothetical protein
MADKKISQLTAASTPLAGTEVLPVVQSGSTVKVAVSDLTAGRAVSALSLASTTGALLATTSGNVGVGPSTASVKLHVQGVATAISGTSKATVLIDDTTAYAANVGGAITFRGKYNAAGDYVAGGYIQAQKTNATDGNDSFDVVLGTRENGSGAAEALRLTDARDVKVTAGNLVVGTAAKGIDFSANTGAAGMTSELLDWYEEGTWTPSLGGDTTYLAQSGIYTRVGRLVWASCAVYVNVLGTGSVDTISGLPFAKNANGGSANCSVPQFSGIATSVYSLSATMSSTSIVLKGMTALGTTNQGALTVFANGTYLEVQTVYSV